MDPMLPAIILFAATYVLMLTFSKFRPYIALASGVIFIATGMLPPAQAWKPASPSPWLPSFLLISTSG